MNQKVPVLLFCLIPVLVIGQHAVVEDVESPHASVYIRIGAGIGPSSFRDEATSPLFYRGPAFSGSLSRLKISEKLETVVGVEGKVGTFQAEVGDRSVGTADFTSFSVEYVRLYQIKRWRNEDWNFKAGGTLISTSNFRFNDRLQNNSFGFESFLNLMGSVKLSKDVSRESEKVKKLWFIHFTLKPRKRILSYQLNVGMWNNSLRNGFAYIDQAGVVNKDFLLWEDYVLRMFSGLRFSSEFKYTLFLTGARNNAMQLSYVWDAVQTETRPDTFSMSFHTIKLALLYNTK